MPVSAFLELRDAPHDYLAQAGKVVSVNGSESALEFTTPLVGATAPQVNSLTSRFLSANDFYTPVLADQSGYIATFRHYVPNASVSYSWPVWELEASTWDTVLNAPFVFPPQFDATAPIVITPYFCVDSVSTGTVVRFNCTGRFIPNATSIKFEPIATETGDTTIAPAAETLYYGTPVSSVFAGTASAFANIRVRRIYGPEIPANQYNGVVYFVGAHIQWSTI